MDTGLHCHNCNQILFSEHTHDFKSCDCIEGKRIFVDGGRSYFRCGIGNDANFSVVKRDSDGNLHYNA